VVAAAQPERLFNRMWSATVSDDNKTEAIAIYPKALAAFEKKLQETLYTFH
jgi:hypothetical protein